MELETYIDSFVMKMQEDAQGSLLNIVPIVLRANILIVNLDTTKRNSALEEDVYGVNKHLSKILDMSFSVKGDGLDLHDSLTLYVMRRENHYDALYNKNTFKADLDLIPQTDRDYSSLMNFFTLRKSGEIEKVKILSMECCGTQLQNTDLKN